MKILSSIAGWLTRDSGIRFLARRRASAVVAVVTMALALGGNTLAFAMAKAFLLTGFAMPEPDRLFVVAPVRELPGRGEVIFAEAYANYARLRATQRSFSDIAVLRQATASWDAGDVPAPLRVAYVSASFFTTTRVQPTLGRSIRADEEGPQAARVAVVSDALWRSGLGADGGVLGRSVTIDGVAHTVVGVMPAGFQHPLRTDVWLPFDLPTAAAWTNVTGARNLTVYARLKDGVLRAAAETEMADQTRLAIEATADNRDFRYTLQQIRDVLVPNAGRVLLVVQLGAALLVLLAVANLAALLIAWGFDRRQEIAVRLALGAGRTRVALMLVTQSVVVVVLGGLLGIVLTRLSLPLVRAVEVAPSLRYFLDEMHLDMTVLAVASLGMGLAGVGAGLLPALLGRRAQLADALRAANRTMTLSASALRWQKGMVVAQASLAVVIVFAAAVVGLSLRNLTRVPIGFQPEARVVARIQLSSDRYPDQEALAAFGTRLLDNLAREGELDGYGFTSTLPVGDPGWGGRFFLDAAAAADDRDPMLLHIRRISDGYPEAMGIPLLAGRAFDGRDHTHAVPVALISQSLARRLWPGEDAVGRTLHRVRAGQSAQPVEIVGVLGDVQDGGLTAPAGEAVYVHWAQIAVGSMSIVVRSPLGPAAGVAAVQHAVGATDGILAVNNTATMTSLVEQSTALPRLQTILLNGFALVAVALLLLGSYGVMMQLVASREREFALRVLFGAVPIRLAASVLGQMAMLGLIGAAVGTAGVSLLEALLEPLVFGVAPRSPLLLIVSGAAVLALALLAALSPALRAMRVDPRKATAV